MLNDLSGKFVLITGGTRGIGLSTALAFGKQGAICTLTHKWGSADEDNIKAQFHDVGAPEPFIVEADAREDEDTESLLRELHERCDRIEVFVSGVAFAQIVSGIEDFSKRSFLQSVEYTAWPTIGYLQKINQIFGNYPRYVVGLSSDGPDRFHLNYDIVAACKSMLETLCRYIAFRFVDEDVRFNVVRAGFVRTNSLDSTMGEDFLEFLDRFNPDFFVDAEQVATTILALCSGLMDGLNGQIIKVDRGASFCDNLMGIYDQKNERVISLKGK